MVWMSSFHGPKGLSVGPNTKEGVVLCQGQFGIMREDFRQDRVTHSLKGYNAILRDMGSDERMVLFVNESSLGTFKLDSENTGCIGKKCKGKSMKFQKSVNSTRFLGILQIVSSDSLGHCKLFHQIPWGYCKLFHQVPWNIANCFIRFLGGIASCFIKFLGILQVVSSDSLEKLQQVPWERTLFQTSHCAPEKMVIRFPGETFHLVPWE
ncbi:hypothetical protein TNCV_5054051 [Trichonephila clavipes]|nr:hypothetical protein TNCV_5054051 [Trichonephila clavipes]